jgi:hypothetical protein
MVLAAFNSFIGITLLAKYWWLVFMFVILLVFIYINSVLLKALQRPELFAVLEEKPPGIVASGKAGSPADEQEGKRILGLLECINRYRIDEANRSTDWSKGDDLFADR